MLLLLPLLLQTPQGPVARPTAPAPVQAPAPGQAPPKAAGAAKPAPWKYRFKIDPDKPQSLGDIGPTEVRTLTYKITNVSGAPLQFVLGDNSPGTTMDDAPFRTPFAPGETRSATLRVDPSGWTAYQRRAIRLETADAKERFTFRVDMQIRPDLTVDDAKKSFGPVAASETPQIAYRFKRETGEAVKLQVDNLAALPPYLEVSVVPMGANAELRATLRPRLIKPGVTAGLEILEVSTNAPLEPKFTLYLDWEMKRAVKPTPSRVVFSDAKVHTATLQLKGEKPFRILTAEVKGAGFSVGILPEKEAKEQSLDLHRDGKPAEDALLVLTFSGVEDPLEVPLSWKDPEAGAAKPEQAPASKPEAGPARKPKAKTNPNP
ncbi:MAG TPA: hypothetical protein VJ600_11275 [Holophagaceae bacterium]|nr:hypothetical protein [Holophagaceae bacterium]